MIYNHSYWEREIYFKDIDVAIIGGGIVGLTTSIFLKKMDASLNVCILERGYLPIGASTRNAGFACFGSSSEILNDMSHESMDQVFSLVKNRFQGLELLLSLVGRHSVDYIPCGGYEIFTDTQESTFLKCLEYQELFNEYFKEITGIERCIQLKDEDISRFDFERVSHLIWNKAEGAINTGKMILKLQDLAHNYGVKLFHGIEVKNVFDSGSNVDILLHHGATINAKKCAICTNAFSGNFLPHMDIYPARNQVLLTCKIPNLKVKGIFHHDCGYYYVRNIEDRILIGGARNIALDEESTDEFGLTDIITSNLKEFLGNRILPNVDYQIEMQWSGVIAKGQNIDPIIESKSENIVLAIKLSGMGVALGSNVGKRAAWLILNS